MENIVQKFGGTSLGTIHRIENVARIIARSKENFFPIVVVSAMSGTTDQLLHSLKQINPLFEDYIYDFLLSSGEQISASLVSAALHKIGLKAMPLTGIQAKITTDSVNCNAQILDIDPSKILSLIKNDIIPVICGFQGCDKDSLITTLGRGGSDLTAVALCSALKAKRCEIYTDVKGVYTTDPNIYADSQLLEHVNYDFMISLSSSGAKVLQKKCVEFAKKNDVKIVVKSSFCENPGTIIDNEQSGKIFAIIPFFNMKIAKCDEKTWKKLKQCASKKNIYIEKKAKSCETVEFFFFAKDVVEILTHNACITEKNIMKIDFLVSDSLEGVFVFIKDKCSEKGVDISGIYVSEYKICILINEINDGVLRIFYEIMREYYVI